VLFIIGTHQFIAHCTALVAVAVSVLLANSNTLTLLSAAANSYQFAVFVSTSHVVHVLGTSFIVTSPVCPFTDSTPVFVIALSRVITQVSHHRRLELLELSQPYGAELLVINVLDE
jgi:hypothetical protein